MLNKRRYTKLEIVQSLIIIVLLTVILIGVFFQVTAGEPITSAGYVTNTRIYITDVCIEGNVLRYTVVNKTWRELYFSAPPVIQRQEGEKWIFPESDKTQTLGKQEPFANGEPSPTFSAFSETVVERVLSEEYLERGHYRIVYQEAGAPCVIVATYTIYS